LLGGLLLCLNAAVAGIGRRTAAVEQGRKYVVSVRCVGRRPRSLWLRGLM
jgi:hypothetical protein